MLPRTLTRCFTTFESTFKTRAVGKAQLKEFLKYTHPDFFQSAPKDVKVTNADSVQNLNSYLQAVQQQTGGVHGTSLKFYIQTKEMAEKDKLTGQGDPDYAQFEVELLPLQSDAGHDLRQDHYTNSIRTLIDALDKVFIEGEENSPGLFAERTGFSAFETSMKMSWEHQVKRAPKKPERQLEDLQENFYYQQLSKKKSLSLANQAKKKVLMNVYRQKYDIPLDLMVRKADTEIKQVVESSEALEKITTMQESGIHPSLIFFEKGMSETLIQKALQRLHGSEKQQSLHKHLLALKETNEILIGGLPHIGIMFTGKQKYSHNSVPGYIMVPAYSFTPFTLKEYVTENINECRLNAKKFVAQQRTQMKINQALQKF